MIDLEAVCAMSKAEFHDFIAREARAWNSTRMPFHRYLNFEGVMHPASVDGRWTAENLEVFLNGGAAVKRATELGYVELAAELQAKVDRGEKVTNLDMSACAPSNVAAAKVIIEALRNAAQKAREHGLVELVEQLDTQRNSTERSGVCMILAAVQGQSEHDIARNILARVEREITRRAVSRFIKRGP